MAFVQRANVILEVKEEQVQRYVDNGYDVLDDSGNVVKKSIPRDVRTLQMAYVEQKQQIERMQAEIDALQAEVKKLKSARSKTVKKQ